MSDRDALRTLPDGSQVPEWTPREKMLTARGEYVHPWDLAGTHGGAGPLIFRMMAEEKRSRAWAYRKRFTTLMSGGTGKDSYRYKKLWTSWETDLAPFIEALSSAGFKDPMPGSFAYPWVTRHSPPPTNPTLQVALAAQGTRPRAWNEAVKTGTVKGRHYVYDINSAYAAAAMEPLPDPRCVVYTRRVTSRPFGMYLVKACEMRTAIVPRRFRLDGVSHWMTKEELERYDVHHAEIVKGCEWSSSVDLRWQIDRILREFPLPMAKKILRAFWGGWSCNKTVDQFMVGKGLVKPMKPLRAFQYCPVWAWHILARVSSRCAEVGGSSLAHVYTDSIMTTRDVATSSEIGGWKLADVVDDPWIEKAGVWGESKDRLRKHAGRKETPDERRSDEQAFLVACEAVTTSDRGGMGRSDEDLRMPLVGESG